MTSNKQRHTLADIQEIGLQQVRAKWPALYTALKYHRTTRGDRMTFRDKLWLRRLYQDNAPQIVVRKCSQVGITEWALCRMIAWAQEGRRGMYLLPDDSWRATFVADRIDGLVDRAPAYRAIMGTPDSGTGKTMDSRQFKLIHGVAWKFAGTHAKTAGSVGQDQKKPKAAFEYQASALILDEYDEHEQGDLVYFYDRLADEPNPAVLKFGNPTIEGRGIAEEFRRSDARRWHVACHCGHEQELVWDKHFVWQDEGAAWRLRDESGRPICEACGQLFDRCGKGRWVAGNPGAKVHGYAISRLFIYKADSDIFDLFAKFLDAQGNQSKLQNFYNNWLGETYENSDEQITEGLLAASAVRGPESLGGWAATDRHRLVAGIDQGKNFHVRISELIDGVRVPRYLGVLTTWDQVNGVLDEFRVTCAVVDAQGGGYAETRRFVEQREGAFMCYYRPKDQVRTLFNLDDERQIVEVNRTELCDTLVADMKSGNCLIPKDYASIFGGEFKRQLMTPVRTLDAGGRPVWTKGVDHFFHASVYETVATLVSGMTNSIATNRSWRL